MGPLPNPRDSGTDGSDGAVPLVTCQTISDSDAANTLTLQSSSATLSFQLRHVYVAWDCAATDPTVTLGMSDTACNDVTGQRLVMCIPVPPSSADAVQIAESAAYVRPAGYTPQGRCGFDEGSFAFDSAAGDLSRLKASFSLTSLLLRCDGGLATDLLDANGAFDIEFPGQYAQACD